MKRMSVRARLLCLLLSAALAAAMGAAAFALEENKDPQEYEPDKLSTGEGEEAQAGEEEAPPPAEEDPVAEDPPEEPEDPEGRENPEDPPGDPQAQQEPPEPVQAPLAVAYAAGPARSVDTAEELVRELERDVGGTITATGDLFVEAMHVDNHVELALRNPVTVDMGPHTLYLVGTMELAGPVHITGSGKVLWLESTYTILVADHNVTISAVGDGAVAVTMIFNDLWADWDYEESGIEWEDWADHEDSRDARFDSSFTRVEAEGDGAVAIDMVTLDGVTVDARELKRLIVTARGPGSVGIRSDYSLELFLCVVEGEETAVSNGTGEIFLDTCPVTPFPQGADTATRTAYAWYGMEWYTYMGLPLPDSELQTYTYYFLLPDEEVNLWTPSAWVPVDWDTGGVDYSTMGEYRVTGAVQPEFAQIFHHIDHWPQAYGDIHVLADGIYFRGLGQQASFGDDEETSVYQFVFPMLTPILEDDLVYTFYREAGMAQWYLIEEQYVTVEQWRVLAGDFRYEDWGTLYEFYMEVVRDGERLRSPILDFEFSDEKGGDRDGTDRDVGADGGGTGSSGRRTGNGGEYREEAATAAAFQVSETAEREGTAGGADTGQAAAPAPVASPSAAPAAGAPPAALYGSTLSYTAAELARLAQANPGGVAFLQGEMTLLVDAEALAGITLGEGERFQVEMGITGARSFYFRLFAGSRELESLGGMTALLPASLAGGLETDSLGCLHESGETIQVLWEEETLRVSAAQAGPYTFTGADAPANNGMEDAGAAAVAAAIQPPPSPEAEDGEARGVPGLLVVVLVAAAAVLGGGGVWLLRARRVAG